MRASFIDKGLEEQPAADDYLIFLVNVVKPLVDKRYPNIPPAGTTRLYMDRGTRGLDALYDDAQSQVDALMRDLGYEMPTSRVASARVRTTTKTRRLLESTTTVHAGMRSELATQADVYHAAGQRPPRFVHGNLRLSRIRAKQSKSLRLAHVGQIHGIDEKR